MKIPLLHELQLRTKPWRRRRRARRLLRAGRVEEAVVLHSRSVPGMFQEVETRLLYRTARAAEGPGDIAEVGSWKGRTAVIQGLAVQHAGHACTVWAIDHHVGSAEHAERMEQEEGGSTLVAFRENVRAAGVADVVRELVMDSLAGARRLAELGVTLRMAFIDGAHDEESVRRDLRAFLPLVRPGGIIALHDCEPEGGFPGVYRAYREELAPHVVEVERASSLLVTRLKE